MPTVFDRRNTTASPHALARTALAAYALLAGSLAMAQTSTPQDAATAAATAPRVVAMDAPAGRTRAEVIAELQCARASGELEAMAMQSYGMPTPPVNRAVPECAAAGGTAVAGSAASRPAP
ncbi:DUF4148 domain-containing protein [Acidovorax sp. BLS4]|uniref:DUF4148 domain-containing protein n=1 Tax=Acidovorax sp. BLS4 TaxID=3273430 RepID=UPI002942161F|nr:DUF4148 domain-containing protein [Paracidovorax avenae]WOI47674.1 DUF4148 domain-containing protein [Paracidovorax avenae]